MMMSQGSISESIIVSGFRVKVCCMSDEILAADFKAEPYWWEAAPPLSRRCDLPAESDFVVVGSGFCGLAAARRALELGARPLVLDAGPIGGGASSRSCAMISSGQKLLMSGASRGLESNLVRELSEAHAEAFEYVRTLTTAGGIEARFQPCGRLFLAAAPRDLEMFAEHAQILSKVAGVTARVIRRTDLALELASPNYHGGLLVEEFGGLHPAIFVRSLALDAQRNGVSLRSHTPVLRARRDGDFTVLGTTEGDIRARHALFATNGYTDAALPRVRQRVAAVGSYIVATEKLPVDHIDALMPGRRMYSDSKRNLWYFRPSPDGRRVLFGARPGIFPGSSVNAAPKLHRYMTRIFPDLKPVRISHAWTGQIALTRSHVQHIGRSGGIWFAVGCNGSGVAIMPWLGRLAAERMLGHRPEPTVFERAAFRILPNIGGRPWYVPMAAFGFSLLDWLREKGTGK